MVGLAMGIYGLAQSFGQIPFGAASDKYGRKRIIVIGLILFALGSFIAAGAHDIIWVIIGARCRAPVPFPPRSLHSSPTLRGKNTVPKPWPWWAAPSG